MNITYETFANGEQTSWGNRTHTDLSSAATLEDAADILLAEIADIPERLRPAVDRIQLWENASQSLPARKPQYVRQVIT